MCSFCNQKTLSAHQLDAVAKLSPAVQNCGMTIRHLRAGGQVYVKTGSDIRHPYTHARIPAGTAVMLTKGPATAADIKINTQFHGQLDGSQLELGFSDGWLDWNTVEFSELPAVDSVPA